MVQGPRELDFTTATSSDIQELVDLVESAYRGEASRRGWTTEADLLEGQRIDSEMMEQLITEPNVVVLCARTGDSHLVACCELRAVATQNEPVSGSCCEYSVADDNDASAYLGMFAVRPQLQGGGIGRAVLRAAEERAVDRWGARTIFMTVIDVRTDLIAWYERRGYSPTGETKEFPYGDERFGRPTRADLRFAVLAKQLRPVTSQSDARPARRPSA